MFDVQCDYLKKIGRCSFGQTDMAALEASLHEIAEHIPPVHLC